MTSNKNDTLYTLYNCIHLFTLSYLLNGVPIDLFTPLVSYSTGCIRLIPNSLPSLPVWALPCFCLTPVPSTISQIPQQIRTLYL